MIGTGHVPVLLEEALGQLDSGRAGTYIDGTLGMGGHSLEILRRNPKASIIGFDRDEASLREAAKRLEKYGAPRLSLSGWGWLLSRNSLTNPPNKGFCKIFKKDVNKKPGRASIYMKEMDIKSYEYERQKSLAMNSQDLINISHKAKNETEAFINRHINDRAKGWPKTCLYSPAYMQYRQEQQAAKGGSINILMAQ